MKINKAILGAASCLTALTLIASCALKGDGISGDGDIIKDCSAVFETRYVGAKAPTSKEKSKKMHHAKQMMNQENAKGEEEKPATECKVLEVKFDKNTKCEFVGSDKINNLSQIISENKGEKMILIAPDNQVRELSKMAQKYTSSKVSNIGQYFESDIFKNLDFPYKGMRCDINGKKIVVWSGNKQVIVTFE